MQPLALVDGHNGNQVGLALQPYLLRLALVVGILHGPLQLPQQGLHAIALLLHLGDEFGQVVEVGQAPVGPRIPLDPRHHFEHLQQLAPHAHKAVPLPQQVQSLEALLGGLPGRLIPQQAIQLAGGIAQQAAGQGRTQAGLVASVEDGAQQQVQLLGLVAFQYTLVLLQGGGQSTLGQGRLQ